MASAASGIITNNLAGNLLTFTDTGSYQLPIVSKVLQVFDYTGTNLLATINMGAALTAAFAIITDGYYIFVLSVTDQGGVVPPATENYLAVGFYTLAFDAIITLVGCACNVSKQTFYALVQGESFYSAAIRFGIGQNAVAAQNNITWANQILAS